MPGGLAMLHRSFRNSIEHPPVDPVGLRASLVRIHLHAPVPVLLEFYLHCFALLQVPLYSKTGFMLLGPSSVEHGQEQWHEMVWRPQEEV
jgi:hypothetical protein